MQNQLWFFSRVLQLWFSVVLIVFAIVVFSSVVLFQLWLFKCVQQG